MGPTKVIPAQARMIPLKTKVDSPPKFAEILKITTTNLRAVVLLKKLELKTDVWKSRRFTLK